MTFELIHVDSGDLSLDVEHPENQRKLPTLPEIVAAGAKAFGLSTNDLIGLRRFQNIAKARHAVTWVAREYLKESFASIGRALNRSHATVTSSYNRAEILLERCPGFRRDVRQIFENLGKSCYGTVQPGEQQ